MSAKFWDSILELNVDGSPAASWKSLGPNLALLKPALRPTGHFASHIQCAKCGCCHEVIRESNLAVCRCDVPTCEDMVIDPAKHRLLALDGGQVISMLAEALPVTERGERLPSSFAWHIGQLAMRRGGDDVALVACFTKKGVAIRQAAMAVGTMKLGQSIFVCKTRNPRGLEALLPPGSRVIGFDDVWTVAGGRISPGKSANRLFSGWEGEAGQSGSPDVIHACDDQFVFKKRGAFWEVIFEGCTQFHIKDSLGAKYIDYLFHRPNVPISCFDLEIAVTPEKAKARGQTSIQNTTDAKAVKLYLESVTDLRAEREGAADDGNEAEVRRLDTQIEMLEEEIRKAAAGNQVSDTGERARGNVRQAIKAVRTQLAKGSETEKKFAQHINDMLSTGYDCSYKSPAGRIWK